MTLAGLMYFTSGTFAADEAAASKEKTLTGEMKCAKCALSETKECQNALVVENKNGKKTTYYLDQNDVSKKFHDTVCKGPKKVTVTGTTKKGENGKRELVASKIEEAK